VKQIYRPAKFDCEHVLGTFIDSSHYDDLITTDTDLWGPSVDGLCTEDNIIFKFRKGVFSLDEQKLAYEGLREAAVQSQNRGMAAGPRGDRLNTEGRGGRDWVSGYHMDVLEWLMRDANALDDSVTLDDIKRRHIKPVEDTRGHVWLRSRITTERVIYDGWFDRWLELTLKLPRDQQREAARYVSEQYISVTNYAQSVMSGVAGYFGRYPRIPYGRATSYTEKNGELFAKSFPYLRKLDKIFREELPVRWAAQRAAADRLDPRFLIDSTVFTTLTVNHNWRTAAHRDAGDLDAGFSNISAVTGKDGWQGGVFILPEYRVGIDLRPGDLLLVANHTGIHANDALLGGDSDDRLSIVAYFREDMFELKSIEYENLRRQFVDERRLNQNHTLWRKLWNGVSEGMWTSDEWYAYMKAHGMADPYGGDQKSSLESFFS